MLMHGRNEKLVQTLFGKLKGRAHSEELGVDERVILE
jgi:hypothetical protein